MQKQVETQGDSLGLHLSISCNERVSIYLVQSFNMQVLERCHEKISCDDSAY
jgi:hypothetical protein